EYALARLDAGAVEHVLAGEIGAAERGKLGIAHGRADVPRVLCRHRRILRIAAVAAVPDIVDVHEAVVGAVVKREIDHRALADAPRRHAGAHRDDAAHDVRALDAREAQRRVAALAGTAPGGHGGGIAVGAVGALAHPDVRVVHAAGGDLDQDFAGGRR